MFVGFGVCLGFTWLAFTIFRFVFYMLCILFDCAFDCAGWANNVVQLGLRFGVKIRLGCLM